GTTTPSAKLDVWGNVNIRTGTSNFVFSDADSSGPTLDLKYDDTSVGAGNSLGSLRFQGNDSTGNVFTTFSKIAALPTGAHGAADNPTDLVFYTTPNGMGTMEEAVRIKDGADVDIGLSSTGGASLQVAGNITLKRYTA